MFLGQVWSTADFFGINPNLKIFGFTEHLGGRGSVLAVTDQNPGPDGQFGTADDNLAPLNLVPAEVSQDAAPGPNCQDSNDRVRGFYSFHSGGAHFLFADGSVHFITQRIAPSTYLALSTIDDREPISDF